MHMMYAYIYRLLRSNDDLISDLERKLMSVGRRENKKSYLVQSTVSRVMWISLEYFRPFVRFDTCIMCISRSFFEYNRHREERPRHWWWFADETMAFSNYWAIKRYSVGAIRQARAISDGDCEIANFFSSQTYLPLCGKYSSWQRKREGEGYVPAK